MALADTLAQALHQAHSILYRSCNNALVAVTGRRSLPAKSWGPGQS